MAQALPLLEIKNLTVEYITHAGTIRALDRISLKVNRSEFLGIVGESGSGKSTLAYATIGVLPQNSRITSGSITFDRIARVEAPSKEITSLRRRRISIVFQDPM